MTYGKPLKRLKIEDLPRNLNDVNWLALWQAEDESMKFGCSFCPARAGVKCVTVAGEPAKMNHSVRLRSALVGFEVDFVIREVW